MSAHALTACSTALFVLALAGCSREGLPDAGADASTDSGGSGGDGGPGYRYDSIAGLLDAPPPPGVWMTLDEAIVTAVWPTTCGGSSCDTVFLADPLVVDGGPGARVGLMVTGVRGARITVRPVTTKDGGLVVEGDVVSASGRWATAVVGDAGPPVPVISGGTVRASARTDFARVATVSTADLGSLQAMAPFHASVVRVFDVPIGTRATTAQAVPVKGGGLIGAEMVPLTALTGRLCARSVTGVVRLAAEPVLMPRLARDLDATLSAGCPAVTAERTRGACADGLDNDWDDATDCADLECATACAWSTLPLMTIKQLQTANPRPAGRIRFDAVLTAIEDHPPGQRDFAWASDPDATALPFGGVRLELQDELALAIGDRLEVAGSVAEVTSTSGLFSATEREIWYPLVEAGAGSFEVLPAAVTATTLAADPDRWFGQLVTLTNHRQTSGFYQGDALLSDGASTVILRERLAPLGAVALPATCFASVTGVVIGACSSRPATNPCVAVAPRGTSDLLTGGTCP